MVAAARWSYNGRRSCGRTFTRRSSLPARVQGCVHHARLIGETALPAYHQCMERSAFNGRRHSTLGALTDDKVRNDGFERVRRSSEASSTLGAPPPPLWDAAKPWTSGMLAVSFDKDLGMKTCAALHLPGWLEMVAASHGRHRKRKRVSLSGSAQPPQHQDRGSGNATDRGKDKAIKENPRAANGVVNTPRTVL